MAGQHTMSCSISNCWSMWTTKVAPLFSWCTHRVAPSHVDTWHTIYGFPTTGNLSTCIQPAPSYWLEGKSFNNYITSWNQMDAIISDNQGWYYICKIKCITNVPWTKCDPLHTQFPLLKCRKNYFHFVYECVCEKHHIWSIVQMQTNAYVLIQFNNGHFHLPIIKCSILVCLQT